jgi:hypothetical protein
VFATAMLSTPPTSHHQHQKIVDLLVDDHPDHGPLGRTRAAAMLQPITAAVRRYWPTLHLLAALVVPKDLRTVTQMLDANLGKGRYHLMYHNQECCL